MKHRSNLDRIILTSKLTGSVSHLELLLDKVYKSKPSKEWLEIAKQLEETKGNIEKMQILLMNLQDENNKLKRELNKISLI